ncbi:hypothetical protein JI739_19670 [Ramlibacter sp. AW1]|uniref:Uncharacterized protein n=1 Tax=Ramlibacter aurantiacus TaxID=2801330 RepID=A0A937D818_9BURK|nr:carboxypeptidase-like regulatory domain-containing protein [Ramlibacter aurantiacus]MBL0422573.1 hypothetical protein [Ramlibacter aurantiacus]
MAYPIDESFVAGIPTGFAQAAGGGSISSITHNASAEAVDLTFNTTQSYWEMLQAEMSTDFWFEYEVELISKSTDAWHFGFWLKTGSGYEGYRYAVNKRDGWHFWQRSTWSGGGSEYNSIHGKEFPADWVGVGVRKRLRIDVKRHAAFADPVRLAHVRISADDVSVMEEWRWDGASFRPGIFGYGCVLRIHGVKGGLGSDLPTVNIGIHDSDPLMLLHPGIERTGFATVRGLERKLGDDPESTLKQGGRITGTVKEKASPVNAPVVRKVVLIDQASQRVLRTAWSDGAGNYVFDQVNPERLYTVVSYDHTGAYRAVIADSLKPTPYP